MDERLPEILELAVAYWADLGRRGVVAVDGTHCDVPVTTSTAMHSFARTDFTEPIHDRMACWSDAVVVNPDKWPTLVAGGYEVRVLAHEVGHVHCLDDAPTGIMSWKKDVHGLEDYQPSPR